MAATETEAQPIILEPAALIEDPDATVYARMVAIVNELPALGKDSYNAQQQFHYRSHDQVMNALNPLLAKHGVFFVPDVLERVPGERTTGQGKTMYEMNLHVRFTFYGLAGDSVVASGWGEGTDMGDKATNKAMTAALKYVLASVFALATADTIDQDGGTPEQTTRGTAARGRQRGPAQRRAFDPETDVLQGAIPLDAGTWAALGAACQEIGPDVDWKATLNQAVQAKYGVATRTDLSDDQTIDYARRVANAVRKLALDHDLGAFPPLAASAPEKIVDAIGWAFGLPDPIVLEWARTDAVEAAEQQIAADTAAAADDDIPF